MSWLHDCCHFAIGITFEGESPLSAGAVVVMYSKALERLVDLVE